MKVYQTNEIRNIALVGCAKSGKTTLAEAMALESGVISRMGSIEDKNTLSDYREIEMERKNSVINSLLYAEINGRKINILDTPGIPDYIGEPLTALNVVETALVLVNATSGIEVGTEIIWRKAQKLNTPILFVINQVDHEKANFEESVRQLKESFGEKVTVAQYPIHVGPQFDALIDLVLHKMIKFPKNGGAVEIVEIPTEEKEKADEMYRLLVEASAQGADDLMEKYFETNDLTIEEMRRGIKLGMANRAIFPVMCVSAKLNIGVARLLEFIGNNVVPPNEGFGRSTINGKQIVCDPTDLFSAFVFKTSKEQHLGEIAYLKIMGGELSEGEDVINANTSNKERISQLMASAGKNRTKIEKACAGDLVCTLKLKDVKSNQTLTTLKNTEDIFVPIEYPAPIFITAIKSINSADDGKLGTLLNEMHEADLSLFIEYSRELKQLLVKGQGEFHINTIKWYLDHIYKIPTEFIVPKIPYRETITKSAEAMYRHKKQSGGAGQFGEVYLMIEPYLQD
ncbi:MAG: GTP-binding protein, partial [Bacteroidales bacterium]